VGEVCTYTETWSVPTNSPAAIRVYLSMFGEYLFNITNTSLWNISIEADSPAQFTSRGAQLDLQQRRRMQGNEYAEETTYGETRIPQTIPWPAPVPVDWRQPFDLAQLFPEYLVENPLTPHESQNLYNTIDCSLDSVGGPDDILAFIRPDALIRISMKFLTETERGFQACLTMTTQNAMRDLLAPFGMTPCRDREYICRSSLEIIPAPSPPPPDNWVRTNASHTLSHAPTRERALTIPRACAGHAAVAARVRVRDAHARDDRRLVGALLRDQRRVLPRHRRAHRARAAQLAHGRHARPARRPHAVPARAVRAARRGAHGALPPRPAAARRAARADEQRVQL